MTYAAFRNLYHIKNADRLVGIVTAKNADEALEKYRSAGGEGPSEIGIERVSYGYAEEFLWVRK